MAVVKPFICIRPAEAAAHKVAALPYDVYSREEACRVVENHPLSFLNIDRAETQFPADVDTYDPRVYEKARELLMARMADGTFVTDPEPCYYLYQLTMDGRSQTGIVACSSIDDYESGVIKRHENTREEKELDRIRHVDVTGAQTGPIFLAYRQERSERPERLEGQESSESQKSLHGQENSGKPGLAELTAEALREAPIYDFVSEDGIGHRVWRIQDPEKVKQMEEAFRDISATYIADGHHRAASAVKVGQKRRREKPGYGGDEPFNFFLSVLFPEDQLRILPYNRVVRDLNGLSQEAFLEAVSQNFHVKKLGGQACAPSEKGTFGMYLAGEWYELRIRTVEAEAGDGSGAGFSVSASDPVKSLDVSLLQDHLLGPVLGIGDPRTDERIDFIGGIRGLGELERRVSQDMAVAFSMYPTSIQELFAVADAGLLMPPKSTWFEPKLRSGLFIHKI